MPDNFGYYQVLGVNENATPQEIKKAYRELAKRYHPDVCHQPDCVQKFREVNEAYEFLKDGKQRTIYNSHYENWGQFSQDEAYQGSLDQIILNLINSLSNPHSLMRNYAVETLVFIGIPAFDAVIKASLSNDEVVRRKTADILGRMGNPQGIPAIIRLLNDHDRFVRRRAAKALTRISDHSAVVPLINALKDPERKVRYRSAEALGRMGEKKAVEPLIESLNDPRSTVRRKAIIALGDIGDSRAVSPITLRLKDHNALVRSVAKHVLREKFKARIGPQSKPGPIRTSGRCPKCGKPVVLNTNFCPSCGHNLKIPSICPECSAPVLAGTNFCTKCGASIK